MSPTLSAGLHTSCGIAVAAVVLVATIWRHVNNPLYHFPGPRTAAWSNLLHSWTFLGGHQPRDILALHEKYGPVVRTSPNELSFNSAQSWKDIYGFRPGHRTFIKSIFYDGGSFADQAHSIVSERDPVVHGKMRKHLSHAFSDRSLTAQEDLISEMIDLFISQMEKLGGDPEGLNIVKWFNLLTFDIIGSLAFGQPFGGLESAKFHPWIDLVTNALQQGALADFMLRFPFMALVMKKLLPGTIKKLVQDTRTHEAYTMNLVQKRLSRQTERPDFLTRMLERGEEGELSDIQIAAHSSDFVTAGSETTATTLACVSYYLMRNPPVLEKLQREIRSAFNSYDEIDAKRTAQLPYLNAVCLEGMRLYAPLPLGLPRVVPEGGDTVDGYFLPAGVIVSTNPIAAGQSSANFKEPLEFKPERWLVPDNKDILDASQPFSLGARGCLGRNLAWMEMNTILSKLHWKFDLELLNTDVDWQRDSRMYTLWKKPELRVKVMPRGA
ncbi:hypothetical protein AUEXF2481DRAFT_2148 [Aureobasidium subglaciale EXF-2481]|uniref:Cytochrome P450 monooxygenase n=1 Tax=Aureobasidium subglaciale (strain EXF-2481) TaxID=1043005 RepID=A0A074YPW9_AURSE|nr:uncharacterized protein AUEXF2481DRAFT_2148 [Aureobasidium subglaciale EXF-2481]KEQ98174.1 hypothetical protein AUEXF2481DRAFT_2148 [Aureobasidium subglaciale EXF-2481]